MTEFISFRLFGEIRLGRNENDWKTSQPAWNFVNRVNSEGWANTTQNHI